MGRALRIKQMQALETDFGRDSTVVAAQSATADAAQMLRRDKDAVRLWTCTPSPKQSVRYAASL